jgi:hypothetical protein
MTISDYLSEILHDSIKAVAEKQMTISIEITPEHESIRIAPSADAVERKKGKWIDSKCSECGGLMPITKVMLRGKVMWETDYPMSRFCPNCGAQMESEREDE